MSVPEKELQEIIDDLNELKEMQEAQQAEKAEENVPAEPEEGKNPKHEKENKKKKHEEKIASLEAEKEELEKKNAELSDMFLRKVAEFDNYRKRTEREKLESFSNGKAKAIEIMLPVLDSLELASATECSDENYKKGVDLTVSLMNNSLEKLGVTKMDALGKPFDPNFHNAVMTEPAGEGQDSGTVSKVFQNGYMLGDKCIRPAMVAVTE